jgi:hypothetical protein
MAILGHRSPQTAMIYTTSATHHQNRVRTGARQRRTCRRPGAGDDARSHASPTPTSTGSRPTSSRPNSNWATACLPQEGPCECDLYLRCPKFITTSAYAPRLHDRLGVEQSLSTTPANADGSVRSNDTPRSPSGSRTCSRSWANPPVIVVPSARKRIVLQDFRAAGCRAMAATSVPQ